MTSWDNKSVNIIKWHSDLKLLCMLQLQQQKKSMFFLVSVGESFSLKSQEVILMLCDFCVSFRFGFFSYILKEKKKFKIALTAFLLPTGSHLIKHFIYKLVEREIWTTVGTYIFFLLSFFKEKEWDFRLNCFYQLHYAPIGSE